MSIAHMLARAVRVAATMVMLAAALLAARPTAGLSQQDSSEPVRVTLVASTTLPRGTRTEVVRRAQRTPQNVVFVDASATPEDLAGAVALLQALRIQYGDNLASDLRARPQVVRPHPTWQSSAYRAWLIEQLVRLRRASPARLSDLGSVGAVQVTLPAARGKVTSSVGVQP